MVCAWLGTAQEFLRRDVVDELRLPVFPVLLGAGRRPLDGVPARRLRLVVAHPFPKSGVVRRTYRRQ
ncbi:dihydrofolate reductase family protein [Nocardia brasiliensis]|uniref:dihydrofolate reductase family protein n=1 Tax=Nocardia brasiliensis TaxID=37326 RepID=UPI00142E80DA|nr:dihydrofolate reductase family protein [Nocardia brasiliensis]